MKLPHLIATLSDEIANRILRLDPDTLERLGTLEDKIIALRLGEIDLIIYLQPSSTGFRVLSESEREPDVTLTGTPFAFARLASQRESDPSQFTSGELKIDGDTELGQRFKRILGQLDIDWEEVASRYVGDVVAHQLGNMARGLRQWGRESSEVLGQDVADYLQEEKQTLARNETVAQFIHDVDVLRGDADRLEARIRRLQEQDT